METDFREDTDKALAVLQQGGIILYPTDTVWGIGCDATDPLAVQKIYALKKRADNKAMIVLVAEEKDVLRYTASPDLRVFDYLEQVTKPTTVIYDHALGLADNLVADDGSIAIRITADPFCRHLIKRFRKPIVSTSANLSGEQAPPAFAAISDVIRNGVDYVVTHRQQDAAPASPSSVIRWHTDGTITVIRP